MNDLILALGILFSVLVVTYFLYLKNRKENYQQAVERKNKILNNLRSGNLNTDDMESKKEDKVTSELAEIKELLTKVAPFSSTPSRGTKAFPEEDKLVTSARKLQEYFDLGSHTAVEVVDCSLQKAYFRDIDDNFLARNYKLDGISNLKIIKALGMSISSSELRSGKSRTKKYREPKQFSSFKKS